MPKCGEEARETFAERAMRLEGHIRATYDSKELPGFRTFLPPQNYLADWPSLTSRYEAAAALSWVELVFKASSSNMEERSLLAVRI